MDKVLSYIGMCKLESGSVVIADPYINRIISLYEKIPRLRQRSLLIDGVKKGNYYAYHLLNPESWDVIDFLMIHEDYSYESLEELDVSEVGKVSTTLGESVLYVDKDKYLHTNNCYYAFDEQILYDCNRIMEDIPQMPYTQKQKEKITALVKSCLKEGLCAIPGQKITNIVGATPVWNGFRDYNDCSTQFSYEIINSLCGSFRNAVVISGGIASNVSSSSVPIYEYREKNTSKVCAICSIIA